MDKDIQTCLTDIASELKGMRHILGAMWHSRYSQGETDVMNPEAYADEYISIEECAKRLELTPKKIRTWIQMGRKDPSTGWVEGVHYVNVGVPSEPRATIRIPWNFLVQSFSRGRPLTAHDFRMPGGTPMYVSKSPQKLFNG